MIPEAVQGFVFFLFYVAFLKVAASYVADKYPGSAIAGGLAWFVPA